MDWENPANTVRYGDDDKPDKYGFTEKMHDIWDLVEAEKPLEEAGFDPTDDDREFYEDYKWQYESAKESNGGKPYKFPRYELE